MKASFKKVAAVVLLVALSATWFVGCSKGSDKDEQGRTIISTCNYPAVEGDARDIYDEKIEAFMKENPDVNIQPSEYFFNVSTFYAKAEAGQLPADIHVNYTEAAPSITAGYVADISDVAKKYDFYDKINPAVMEVISRDGKLYAIPASCYALGLVFNAKLFKQAGLVNADGSYKLPRTWDEVVEYGKIIKEKTGAAGYITPTTGNAGGWLFTPVAWSFGVDFMEQDKDGKWHATFDTPEAVAALQFMKDLKWKHNLIPANVLLDNSTAEQEFYAGNAAMMIRSPESLYSIANYGANNNDFGVTVMPAGPKRHVTLLGGGIRVFNSKLTDDQLDAAVRWVKWDFSPDLSESTKKYIDDKYALYEEQGKAIGMQVLSPWSEDTEAVMYEREVVRKYMNIEEANVKEYNDFAMGLAYQDIEIQPEEPVCAQELYEILDGLLQEVFTNKDADCAALIKGANNDLQNNYLDYL